MKRLAATEENFRELATAADRLLTGVAKLTDTDTAAASRLPGWSRAHVLSHLARQAPALERLLEWARTGVENPQYASRAARDAEIEQDAHKAANELLTDVRETAVHFQHTIERLPAPAWQAQIRPFTGELCTPERILVIRLRELEVHHVDLDVGYSFHDIPDTPLRAITEDVTGYLAHVHGAPHFELRDDTGAVITRFGSGGPIVSGSRPDILAWLTGRSSGSTLHSTADLPRLPGWI